MFEDFDIEIHCPECDVELEVKLSQIAGEESVTCPCCQKSIGLKPDPKPGPEEVKSRQVFREYQSDHTQDKGESLKNVIDGYRPCSPEAAAEGFRGL